MNCENINKAVSISDELLHYHLSFVGFSLYRKHKNKPKVEAEVAKQLISSWSKNKICIVCYENAPKGEIGIIPITGLKYEIYETTIDKNNIVKLANKLDVRLATKLVAKELTTMRSPYDYSD